MNNKYYFECVNCCKKYSSNEVTYLCPECEKDNDKKIPPKGVLKTLYDYKKIKSYYKKENLLDNLKENNYIDLLPIKSIQSLSFLKVGRTPLYEIKSLRRFETFARLNKLPFKFYLKDDSQNPTFSFKDRASNLVSAYAKENGIDTIVTASTGNAGSSLAGICASQNQKAIVFVPASAPKAKLIQIAMYGGIIIPVKGTYDDAFNLSIEATKKFGWYNRNTAYNPFTIEGKKTVSFEIFNQMKQELPDRIFVPVGDGVIISGVYKGFEDLLKLDLIEKIPIIIAVQSEGSDNLIRNLKSDKFISRPSHTIADSISVDIPRNFWMTKKFIKEYNGEWVFISDEEIISASKILSENTGIFAEPAGVASFAGMLKYEKLGKIDPQSKNVILITGSGLKDLKAVEKQIFIPKSIKPNLSEVERLISNYLKQE
ncbi:MAG: threonine synthase [Candidatus Cloacimonetes bacterium]|nr:threonine synthase [Candidatus Cloacimonadota bacterium]